METAESTTVAQWVAHLQACTGRSQFPLIPLGRDDWALPVFPGSWRSAQAMIRRNLSAVREALGAVRVDYVNGTYNASGRGAFGRLGGGRRAVRVSPYLRVIYEQGGAS